MLWVNTLGTLPKTAQFERNEQAGGGKSFYRCNIEATALFLFKVKSLAITAPMSRSQEEQ